MGKCCKFCGAPLDFVRITPGMVCEFCFHAIEEYSEDAERENKLLAASQERNSGSFDSALQMYREMKADYVDDYQTVWGRLLCKYGVVYVEKDETERVMQCWKSLPSTFVEETDYKQAYKMAPETEKDQIRKDAETIMAIQNKIRSLADKQYDIFICYKETDFVNGATRTTRDSDSVEELYYSLLREKYKVFFAKVALESKAGADYEAEIFNAIEKSRVMIVFGSKEHYFTSTWVKSEWERFLKASKTAKKQKVLIPLVDGLDPYRLPAEFNQECSFFEEQQKRNFEGLKARLREIFSDKTVMVLAGRNEKARSAMVMIEDGDIGRGLKILKEEAEGRNRAEACYLLGSYEFENGEDDSVAFEWFKRAAETGYPDANYQVSIMYELGLGVKQNKDKAEHYLKRYKRLSAMGS